MNQKQESFSTRGAKHYRQWAGKRKKRENKSLMFFLGQKSISELGISQLVFYVFKFIFKNNFYL